MRIQLRQTEIEEALQQYIVTQGINLAGKDVKIDFTSSRGEAGLTADVDITNAADGAKHRAAPVVQTAEVAPAAQAIAEPVQEEQTGDESDEEPAKEAVPASSLFS